MGLACLLALSLAAAPVWTDRTAFYRAMDRVEDRMTPAQVRQILGEPDDVWVEGDVRIQPYASELAWCYGVEKARGVPLLGRVYFQQGRVLINTEGVKDRPFKRVLSERELRRVLIAMGTSRNVSRFEPYDPLWVIQATNLLRPLGKDGALQAIEEFHRIGAEEGNRLFWLMRTLFEVPKSPGHMPELYIGAIDPEPPTPLTKSPRFPIVVQDDVPFNLFRGALLRGVAQSPMKHLDYFRKEGTLRKKDLQPPDDPFLAYQNLLKSREWPYPARTPGEDRFVVPYEEDEGYSLRDVLILVRHAYRVVPPDEEFPYYWNGLDYEKLHSAFLALKPRWDEQRQMYVRGDGSATADHPRIYPIQAWEPKGFGDFTVTFTLRRTSRSDLNFSASVRERQGKEIHPATIRFWDFETGKLLGWVGLNGGGIYSNVSPTDVEYLSGKPHAGKEGSTSMGSGFGIPQGTAVVLELVYRGRSEKSSPFET